MKTYYDDGTTRIRSMLPEDAKILCDIYLKNGEPRTAFQWRKQA